MELKVILVCCVVGFLGLLAAATGFSAESTIENISHKQPYCLYPKSPTVVFGFTACFSLFMSEIVLMFATGPHQSNIWIIVLSRFVTDSALFMFVFGLIDIQTGKCQVLAVPGFFAAAAVLSLVSIVLGITRYLKVNTSKKEKSKMHLKVILVCCVVGFLGLLSAATGFTAEATRFMENLSHEQPYCLYPESPTVVLGFTAGGSLLFSYHILFHAMGPNPPNIWIVFLSWCVTFSAFFMFVIGLMDIGTGKCQILVVPGFFAVAAVLSLVSVVITCYLMVKTSCTA
ncbi:hypothetical protein CASFOL_004226 [Castilleja foliolosa]|uniref:Uncharacterized protein n=1 Tax=Castilleja foliolosa TaxID=1961234 RepID=A0ABD3EAL3_9LAMI